MPLAVDFQTIPELVRGLRATYGGTGKALLGYKDKKTKAWTDLSVDEVVADVEAFAAYLWSEGVRPGDRVALLSENRPEWAVTDLAAQMLGAVTVALYATVPASEVAYIARDSGARVLVVSTGLQLRKGDTAFDDCPELQRIVSMAEPRKARPEVPVTTWDDALAAGRAARAEHAAALDALADAVTPDTLSALIYTSGTTGEPKGVRMTHRNLCTNARDVHAHVDVFETDVHLSFLPLSHAFERTAGYTTMLSGGGQIVYAESIDTVAKNLPEVQPTIMVSVPRLFEKIYNVIQKSVAEGSPVKRGIFAWAVDTGRAVAAREREGQRVGPILKAQHALAHRLVFQTLHDKLGGRVRFCVSGGAALPRAIGEFFEAAGVRLIEGYGLSETAPVLAANPLEAPVFGTVGHVFEHVTVAIRDLTTGRILGQLAGTDYPSDLTTAAGEILAKGPNVMDGYWNRPDATAEAFDDEGWFKTGDVGRFEGGYLRITDRIKHMIVSKGGKNIYPGPLEEALGQHTIVDQVMIVGEGREFLTALVVPDAEAVRAELASAGHAFDSDAAMLGSGEARALFADLLRAHAKASASHEKVRDLRLVAEPFSVENELLTPTMKLKRRAIEAAHADLVEQMYADVV